jgi:SAM-dependent methyltransferase
VTSPSDDIIDLYERHAHDYVADRGRAVRIEDGWLTRFANLLAPGSAVLDIGCGSGEPIARHLIDKGFAVTGVDASPTLISLCRERFPDRNWHVADMRHLALGTTFGGLLAWDSFFHLTPADQREMFAVFKRHAAKGAALMFTSGGLLGESIGSYHGDPLYHGSLSPEEYETLLKSAGFRVVAHVTEDPDCGGHTIWLAQASGEGQ